MPEEITTIEKDGAGRPCKYESHVQPRLGEVLDWLKKGYTDYSIADTLGVGYSTWMKYKAEILELQDVYTRARTHRNNLVMNAQFG
jgi:DNA-binding NarL/FixJ family response regulator